MTNETQEVPVEQLLAELDRLDAAIESRHPGCLTRSDLWNLEGTFHHGMRAGSRCPASDLHHRRRKLSGEFNDLVAAGAFGLAGMKEG